ncbi:glycoside hydrolase family 3 protein [Daejeonella sp.]|jgi:beta-glucosidase-like glycosyl hydrolase|uniref:glycoside hydrolase family 3 protein n=1 Tax=Daejeonella sp. TaxID=2805397 RepID=UPI00378338D8
MYKKLKQIVLVIAFLIPLTGFAQSPKSFIGGMDEPNAWVDSVFKKLSKRDRIAQMFMVRAHTDKGQAFEDSIAKVIKKERIGGLVFFQGGPVRQALLTNRYQSISKVPLMLAMDGEWGLGMRLDSTVSFPYQLTLGAIQDNTLIYEMGRQVALDFKRIGMHVNFAPVADINNNPKNPVIGFRSFGDNKFKVAEKVTAYMKGLQDNQVIVSVKHFPGHGDTDVDSHYDLPKLPFTKARLDSIELYPFKELIKEGASGMMVAHMNIPALDNTPNLPSTLSKPIITTLLKEELGFKGLIFSDAMEMKGVAKFFPNGEADVLGIMAGLDVIELSGNSKRAVKLVRQAIRKNKLAWSQVNASVKKILYSKYWAGLHTNKNVQANNLIADLNRRDAAVLNQKLADAAITLLNGDIQLKNYDRTKKTAILSIGINELSVLQTSLRPVLSNSMNYILPKNITDQELDNVRKELKGYDQIIVGIHDMRKRPAPVLDYNKSLKAFIGELSGMNSLFAIFANPYSLAGLPGIESAKTILMNYQNTKEAQNASFRVINGGLKASGRLPVTINSSFKNGDGLIQ